MTATWDELLKKDHETTERVFAAAEKIFASKGGPTNALVASLLDYARNYVDQCHNMKEEKHLFPLVEKRGIPRGGGPLAVMLGEHEQSRALVASMVPAGEAVLAGDRTKLPEFQKVFSEYASLLKAHFWKENDILYPMAVRVMQPGDGEAVVAGIAQVEASLGQDTREKYYRMADEVIRGADLEDLSFGLSREVLAAILNFLPVELSFVDAEDTVRYFSHEPHTKVFGRTRGAIGTKVHNCHPKKSVHMVEAILADFKTGKRDVAEFWIDMGPKKIHIRYWPVRDAAGRYLGCLETVQDVTSIRALEGQKRLLDT